MKLNFIFGLLFSVVALQMKGAGGTPEGLPPFVRFPGLEQEVYITRDTCKSVEGRFPGFSPFFVIYPDKPCDASEAAALTDELGIASYAHTYSGTVCVMNPLGKEYDAVKDLEAYKNFLNKMRVFTNLKIIGIGKGATFVNRTIAGHAGAVAGIVSLNGRPAKTAEGAAPVPAFIAGTHSRQVAAAYILQNQAEPVRKEDGLACYANRQEPLQQVVVSANKYISLKEAFAEAWKTLLCKNYRFNNYEHTWYTGAQFDQYGTYELEPYIMPEDWGITRRVMKKDLIGTGDFLWYEFHPEATLKAEKASVPLLLLLHGNNNDPRTQAETSGFIELAVEENFIVAELEWQGNGYAPMGLDGIEQVVYHLLKTYPQIDPSRVYAEGLSAGAATATGLGIRKSHVFAAVGAQSAGLTPDRYMFGYSGEALMNEAVQKRGSVETAYFSVTGTDDEVVPFVNENNWRTNAFFCAWTAYQTMNGMEVSSRPDFSKDATFGIALKDREVISTNKRVTMEAGVLYKGNIPLIKVVAVNDYGHWNFKPDARLMWDFMKQFSRGPQTKKLVYNKR